MNVSARLVVGADGAFSKVRESLGITTQLHRYSEGYLIAIIDAPHVTLDEARYLVGRHQILGLFPAAGGKIYVFYMIEAGSYEAVKARGLDALRQTWVRIDPGMEAIVHGLVDWSQTGYMPTGRVKTDRWVADGALLIGDAAHAMNPHASQGRMQAMVDAVVVADLIPGWLKTNDFSAMRFARSKWPAARRSPCCNDWQMSRYGSGILGTPCWPIYGIGCFVHSITMRGCVIACFPRQQACEASRPFLCWIGSWLQDCCLTPAHI